jgi:hypothetical protein
MYFFDAVDNCGGDENDKERRHYNVGDNLHLFQDEALYTVLLK